MDSSQYQHFSSGCAFICILAPMAEPRRCLQWSRLVLQMLTEAASPVLHSLPFGQKVTWTISELPPVKINWQIVSSVPVCCFVVGDGDVSVFWCMFQN